MDNNNQVFFELVRAGLWDKEARLSQFGIIDYNKIFRLSKEQSVIGLVAEGLEHVVDVIIPQEWALQFAGQALQIEQRNFAMNKFVANLIKKLQKENVYMVLVKGQGVAQCYERPCWRVCGDIDLLLNNEDYQKAKTFLQSFATTIKKESAKTMHLGMIIDLWVVELHGTLRSVCLPKMDKVIDAVVDDTLYSGKRRSWINENVQVFLPDANNDVFIVFTHILKHFFHGGIGLRQICDWCRLLWTLRDDLDIELLGHRLKVAGIQTEWKGFAALAVEWLGFPYDAMPFYSPKSIWKKKADMIIDYIIMVGNFGHNRDFSYYTNRPYIVRKAISFGRRTSDGLNLCSSSQWIP